MKKRSKIYNAIAYILADEERQKSVLFVSLFALLAVISLIMTVVNYFTGYRLLMWTTLAFALLCLVNIVIARTGEGGKKFVRVIFQVEAILLVTSFVVHGEPQGFSALWAVLIPAFAMLMYREKSGLTMSGIMFAVLVFFYWVPAGRELLRYEYTDQFMLRFPVFYLGIFVLTFVFEKIRAITYDNYIYEYTHDSLTGALNRRGFEQKVNAIISDKVGEKVGIAFVDLDSFKVVNDTYGHFTGDTVLKECAWILNEITGLPVCRWGGDEFVIVDAEGILTEKMIEKINKAFSAGIAAGGRMIQQTVSIGVVIEEISEGITLEDLYVQADKHLYEAKKSGKNNFVFCTFQTENKY